MCSALTWFGSDRVLKEVLNYDRLDSIYHRALAENFGRRYENKYIQYIFPDWKTSFRAWRFANALWRIEIIFNRKLFSTKHTMDGNLHEESTWVVVLYWPRFRLSFRANTRMNAENSFFRIYYITSMGFGVE